MICFHELKKKKKKPEKKKKKERKKPPLFSGHAFDSKFMAFSIHLLVSRDHLQTLRLKQI